MSQYIFVEQTAQSTAIFKGRVVETHMTNNLSLGQVLQLDHLKRLCCRVEKSIDTIRQEHQKRGQFRIVFANTLSEYPRMGQIALGDNGTDKALYQDTGSTGTAVSMARRVPAMDQT